MKLLPSLVLFSGLLLCLPSLASAEQAGAAPQPSHSASQEVQSLVNINTADVATLVQLKGIGPKKAEAIIAWRKANGQFKNIEQLMDVKGIGEAILKANKGKITI